MELAVQSLVYAGICLFTISNTDYSQGENHTPVGLALKILPILFLILCSWRWSSGSRLHTAALALSALGDIFIGFMTLSRPCFALSLVSFGASHACYLGGFWGGKGRLVWGVAVPLAAFLLPLSLLTADGLGKEALFISTLLRLYGAVLSFTTFAAVSHHLSQPKEQTEPGTLFRSVGFVVFSASDAIILLGNFSQLELPNPGAQLVVISTYYTAQLLIFAAARPVPGKSRRD